MRHIALFIVGPTATGKTDLALQLSKVIPSTLISADSRQVYKGMDIGTGKDYPKDGTQIHLIDQVFPNEEWSVSHFQKAATTIMHQAWEQHKLPIIVGGTGLYTHSLINTPQTIHIPQDQNLRMSLEKLSLQDLQKKLSKLDQKKFQSMNHSDRNNPRRFIRAIEVATYLKKNPPQITQHASNLHLDNTLWIGLEQPQEALEHIIQKRVEKRLQQGMEQELEHLMKNYPDWNSPSFSALGYKETRAYLENKCTKQELIETWTKQELQYAKRQMTWFKKRPYMRWFHAHDSQEQTHIAKMVKTWYDKNYATH